MILLDDPCDSNTISYYVIDYDTAGDDSATGGDNDRCGDAQTKEQSNATYDYDIMIIMMAEIKIKIIMLTEIKVMIKQLEMEESHICNWNILLLYLAFLFVCLLFIALLNI